MILYKGNNFLIRTWQKGDEPCLARNANNYNIWKFLQNLFPYPYTYDDATYWIELNEKKKVQDNFAIIVNDEAVGNIGILPGKDIFLKNVELGYWLGEDYWGRGIITESIDWITSYAKEKFGTRRIWAAAFANNHGSIRVLEKNGFAKEAHFKEAVFKEGNFIDEHIYSKLI